MSARRASAVEPERREYESPGRSPGSGTAWSNQALKGRDVSIVDPSVRLSRPYRANKFFRQLTQGCALGYRIAAFQAYFVFVVVSYCALSWPFSANAQTFSFDDIDFWVGTGANRAALAIDWVEDAADPPALVWGYRWDGAATGSDMLTAIVAADPRLFAKLGGSPATPNAVFGLGYDTDADGVFGIDDGTEFDSHGFAYNGSRDTAIATDPGDYYAEGWFTGFWHYGVEATEGNNPYDGGNWTDTGEGMAGRDLVNGSWDSWVFSLTFDFAAFAENPVAAAPPYPPGDFNYDGEVDASDYTDWSSTFGSTTALAADGNSNGTVDAADYVVWRKNLSVPTVASSAAVAMAIPEPSTPLLSLFSLFALVLFCKRKELVS